MHIAMAEEQVTTMVIKVDLQCKKCSKKITKVLCEIPETFRTYDKKANTVTITVVCCSAEKIKQKICCKGGGTIKGIEIKVPEKPKPQEKPTKDPDPVPQQPPLKVPVLVYPPRTCCRECYEGGHGGLCFHGCGTPAAPPCYVPAYGRPVYDGWGAGSCNCRRSGYHVCRCEHVCDDNRSSCIIM